MGDTPSRPLGARPGAPTVGGTTLEAALAQVEDERARAANPPPPPGVRPGEEEVELSEFESDEQMALRLQREEDARAAAPARAPVTSGVYYPEIPYGAPTFGRQLMSDIRPAPPSAPSSSVHRDRHPNARHHPTLPPIFHPATPYAQPVPYGGFQPPHLTPTVTNDAFAEDDAALARRLQAEEDAAAGPGPGRGGAGAGAGSETARPASDAALAAALQAEEDANARGGSGPGYHSTSSARPNPSPWTTTPPSPPRCKPRRTPGRGSPTASGVWARARPSERAPGASARSATARTFARGAGTRGIRAVSRAPGAVCP